MKNRYEKPLTVFREYGGIARTCEVLRAGIHPRMLYEMLSLKSYPEYLEPLCYERVLKLT